MWTYALGVAALALALASPAGAFMQTSAKTQLIVQNSKSNSKSFDAYAFIATKTKIETCFDYEEPDSEGFECEQPCAGTDYFVSGFVLNRTDDNPDNDEYVEDLNTDQEEIVIRASFRDTCSDDYNDFTFFDAEATVPVPPATWIQSRLHLKSDATATLVAPPPFFDGEAPAPAPLAPVPVVDNKLDGAEFTYKLRFGCSPRDLDTFKQRCADVSTGPNGFFNANRYQSKSEACNKEKVGSFTINGEEFMFDNASFYVSKDISVSFQKEGGGTGGGCRGSGCRG